MTVFGRKRKSQAKLETAEAESVVDALDGEDAVEESVADSPDDSVDDVAEDVAHDGADGPFDSELVSNLDELAAQPTMLDLGSVVVPIPEGGQIQVDLAGNGSVNNVFVTVAGGRISMTAFAAPKSAGQWRDVVGELSESLRGEGATVSVTTGPWGREVLGSSAGGDLRFIGVDGPRWMLRCVAVGAKGLVEPDSEFSELAREVVRGTVVRRGSEPLPARSPLTITLPEVLATQLEGAREQQMAQHQQEQQRLALQQLAQQQQAMSQALRGDPAPTPTAPAAPEQPRQNPNGSAMQQLRNKP
ncbi:DUF3710 domain-containing protein [Tomitella biformata]|uniref:DUF3710 domain-containing protein n=1 Tax=Tomitella biformata TaxID=630403 RepID=UPI0004B0114E|nr:DUF3710 domain-containing protein [Tomitella biformata]